MNCPNNNETITCPNTSCNNGNGFLIIIVLYILLAIIIGSRRDSLY